MANRLGGATVTTGGGALTAAQTAALASIPQKADQAALAAEIADTDADVTAHDGRITTLETTAANDPIQDGRLDALDTEQAAQDAALALVVTGQTAQDTKITALEAGQTTQDTELARLETDKADKTQLPRVLTTPEAEDETSTQVGLITGQILAGAVDHFSPLPVMLPAALSVANLDTSQPTIRDRYEVYEMKTRRLAVYHATDTTGDVIPNTGPGSWFYVGSQQRTLEDTTDGQVLEWMHEYVLHPGFKYTFPTVTEDFGTNWLIGLPSNQNWQVLFDSAADWSAPGAQTIGVTQVEAITATSGELRFIGRTNVTPNNIEIFVNSGINTVPSMDIDSSSPIDTTRELTVDDTALVKIPATGDFFTGPPRSTKLENDALVELRPLATIAPDTVSTPLTVADALLFELVGQGGPSDSPWIAATDGMTLEWGQRYIFTPTHNYTWPAVTEEFGDNWIEASPSGPWSTFTGTWTTQGTDTIGDQQAGLDFGERSLHFFGRLNQYSAGINNIELRG